MNPAWTPGRIADTVRLITLDDALDRLVRAGLMRIVRKTVNGKMVDGYEETEEGRRRWSGSDKLD